jgi:hypothetical protein
LEQTFRESRNDRFENARGMATVLLGALAAICCGEIAHPPGTSSHIVEVTLPKDVAPGHDSMRLDRK